MGIPISLAISIATRLEQYTDSLVQPDKREQSHFTSTVPGLREGLIDRLSQLTLDELDALIECALEAKGKES